MPLDPGVRLGPYEVVSALGAGGMGEVYRARDTRLQRDVALKILPEIFSTDPERLARFEREAQVLASLNHPHIAQIYGVEESGGVRALVMELVDGETLADRIGRGAIPVGEAVPIATQIAEALEAAHEQGIIHRDLKPANIKVRGDGTVKVLDFGLAKLAAPAAAAGAQSQTMSPTITSPALATGVGVLLGTAAYMSPEQAKGREADKRSDVWAFGCVLFEMLTGRRAFEGDDVSDTLAAVLRAEPDWAALPADVPAAICTVMKRSLERDRRRRIGDIAVAIFVIEDQSLGNTSPPAATAPSAPRQPFWRRALPYALLALITAILTSIVAERRPQLDSPVTRFALPLGSDDTLTNAGRHLLAVSPDGRRIVYAANNQLYLRSLDRLEAAPIRGAEGPGPAQASAREPFFSPDGQWIAYWAGGQFKKIAITGGAPVVICAALIPYGASWGADGNILYGEGGDGVWRVSGDGGAPKKIISVAAREAAHGPQLLPGGRAVLFTLAHGTRDWDEAEIVLQWLDTGKREVVVRGGTDARYLPTGHLVYALRGTVLAIPFDAKTGRVGAGPVPVLDQVAQAAASVTGAAHFSVSDTGTFVYVRGGDGGTLAARTLTWVDRRGHETPLSAPPRPYQYARLSPDGSRVAVDILDANRDIWMWDLRRATLTRLTSDPSNDLMPVWTTDGRRVIFTSDRSGYPNLYIEPSDGTAEAERLVDATDSLAATGVTPDGTRIVGREINSQQNYDLFLLGIGAGSRRIEPLLNTSFNETNAVVSPDGRWVAYSSDESGQDEIYVRPFPKAGDGRWQVSTGGGRQPLWSHTGRELFYRSTSGAFMRVGIPGGPEWRATTPSLLFDGRAYLFGNGGGFARTFDLSLDDGQFLVVKGGDINALAAYRLQQPLIVIQNWFRELNARVPTK